MYSELRTQVKKEEKNSELCKIENDFYYSIGKYLSRLRQEAKDNFFADELAIMKDTQRVLERISRSRINKIANYAISEANLDCQYFRDSLQTIRYPENLCKNEKVLYVNLVEALIGFKKEIKKDLENGENKQRYNEHLNEVKSLIEKWNINFDDLTSSNNKKIKNKGGRPPKDYSLMRTKTKNQSIELRKHNKAYGRYPNESIATEAATFFIKHNWNRTLLNHKYILTLRNLRVDDMWKKQENQEKYGEGFIGQSTYSDKFYVLQYIDDILMKFGEFDSLTEARKAINQYSNVGWDLKNKELVKSTVCK